MPVAIPECRLDASALGPQISRYRRLAEHVTGIERNPGEVRVQFDEDVPDGLLTRSPSSGTAARSSASSTSQPGGTLAFTVANVAQDSRLDSLAALLTARQ